MDLILKNMMEPLVLEKIDEIIDTYDCCKCEQCRMDVATLALNHLPPKYVATRMGTFYTRLEALSIQHGADVLSAISRAVVAVQEKPHHDPT